MTEAEGIECSDPERMLRLLRGKASDRKLRAFACGCCRLLWWDRLHDPRSRAAVEAGERYSDGLISLEQLGSERGPSERAVKRSGHGARWRAARAAASLVLPFAWLAAEQSVGVASGKQLRTQTVLLRDIFGNPFRPASPAASWLRWNDGAVRKLAMSIYDKRAFADLPVLADALEDAGCADAAILAHCRQPGQHVRGCWVIDLLLGKA
jgi:hypothetical protein